MSSSWATILGLSQPAELDGFLPMQEGFFTWTRHLGLDQQRLEAALYSKEDSYRGRVRQEIEQCVSHLPLRLPHWQQFFSWILTTLTGNWSIRRCQHTTERRLTAGALPASQHIRRRQHLMMRPSAESRFSTRTMPRQIPWQPACSAISMATLCFELGDSLPCSVSDKDVVKTRA